MGYKTDPVRKVGWWFSLRANHPLFSSAFTLHFGAKTWEEGSTTSGWVLPRAHFQWSPPSDLAETLRRNSPLALQDWHPHTGPHFIHQLQGWVKSHSPRILSLASFPSPRAKLENPHTPRPSALRPVWLWNRGRPFQSRLVLPSERVLRTGTPFLSDLSPRFLSPLSNLPIWPQWEILNPSP